jgi:nucleotide-binding universal stress UspA family protein
MAKQDSPKVLIALDFGEQSLLALSQGIHFSKALKAEVTLLHVMEDTGMIGKHLSDAQYALIKKESDEKIREQIELLSSKHKLAVTGLSVRGKVYEKILETAAQLNAALILMGCWGNDRREHHFIGSNTLQVIRTSAFPVCTVKAKHPKHASPNIVLPLDLTKETREKVSRATELAILHHAAVRVVSVSFTKDEFIVNRLTLQMAQVKNEFEKSGIECTGEIMKGVKGEENLAQCIVDYASRVDGDLLMIMTQQEVDSTDYFIGSSAQEMILRAEMPVLTIIPPSVRKKTKTLTKKK